MATGTTIGRANLDGSRVNQSFITRAHSPEGPAVGIAPVYWANQLGDTIGRGGRDGPGATQGFVTGMDSPTSVAVDGLGTPVLRTPPQIKTGAAPTVGTDLAAGPGRWTNNPTSYTYQWVPCEA